MSVPFFSRRRMARSLTLAAVLSVAGMVAHAQTVASTDLPDAPQTGVPQDSDSQTAPQTPPATQNQQQTGPASSSASPQSGNPQSTESKEDQQKRAAEELKKEEQQRMLGVVPMFNVTSNQGSAPLTPREKFQLMFKSSTDPYIFALTGITAGISMAQDNYPAYGVGVEGFAKYWGANYADTFDGNFWGNAVLPSWWHEDPRYFRMGHGSFIKRMSYSAATTVWCRRDNGKWGPNYGNVVGNFIAGGISNLYYPQNQRGIGETFDRGATVTYEGIVGAELAEFWPDIAQHFLKKRREKQEREAAEAGRTATTPAAPDATKPVEQPNGTTTPKPDSQ